MKPKSTLLYGDSGTTKTSQLYFFAKYLLKKWKEQGVEKKIRLVSADGGGYAPFQDSGMIERGEVQVFDMTNRPHAFADIHRVGVGYWPRTKKKKSTGERFIHLASDADCLSLSNTEVAKDNGKIGAYLIEGTTSLSSCLLNHIRNQHPDTYFREGSKAGQLKGSFVFTDDDYVTMGGQESHYGMVQQEMYQIIVQEFETLPVEHIWWTGLTGRGEDKRTGQSVYGPKLAGDKRTSEAPSWFMDTYHLADEVVEGSDGKKREVKVAWFKQHRDELGIPYLCKPRVLPEKYPKLLKAFPNGFVELGFERGIDKLIEVVGEL